MATAGWLLPGIIGEPNPRLALWFLRVEAPCHNSRPMFALTQPRSRPYLALLLGILSLGASGKFVSLANAPGIVTDFYRVGIATLALAYPFWRRRLN